MKGLPEAPLPSFSSILEIRGLHRNLQTEIVFTSIGKAAKYVFILERRFRQAGEKAAQPTGLAAAPDLRAAVSDLRWHFLGRRTIQGPDALPSVMAVNPTG